MSRQRTPWVSSPVRSPARRRCRRPSTPLETGIRPLAIRWATPSASSVQSCASAFLFARLYKPRLAPAAAELQHAEIDPRRRFPGGPVAELIAEAAAWSGPRRRASRRREPDARAANAPWWPAMRLSCWSACPRRWSRRADGARAHRSRPHRQGPRRAGRGALLRVAPCGRRHIGRPSSAHRPAGVTAKIAEVRRGDAVLFPAADLVLEYGDRVTVIAPRRVDCRVAKAISSGTP